MFPPGTVLAGSLCLTEQAVEAIGGITHTLGDLGAITTTVASAIEEQAAATGEIARHATEAATGTEAISETLTGLARTSSDTGSAAEQGLDAASRLSGNCGLLTRSVKTFVESRRAA